MMDGKQRHDVTVRWIVEEVFPCLSFRIRFPELFRHRLVIFLHDRSKILEFLLAVLADLPSGKNNLIDTPKKESACMKAVGKSLAGIIQTAARKPTVSTVGGSAAFTSFYA